MMVSRGAAWKDTQLKEAVVNTVGSRCETSRAS